MNLFSATVPCTVQWGIEWPLISVVITHDGLIGSDREMDMYEFRVQT
jgi:hypothetical protein